MHRFAQHLHLTAVGLIHTGHDFDQRALASAVLTEQSMHFAGIQRQRYIIERLGGVKALGDVVHLQHGHFAFSRRHGSGGILGEGEQVGKSIPESQTNER